MIRKYHGVKIASRIKRQLYSQKHILWCSGFRTGDVKGARWMPWLRKAMKDVTSLRKVSGR
jgi:hypothetical protein